MPSSRLKDENLQQLVAEAYGKMLADQAYGSEGPGLDVDLATMEDLAVTMQETLLKGMCEQLTRQQAARLPGSQPCPQCGGECEVEQPPPPGPDEKNSSRPMHTRGGAFELTEPRCYCRSCRRSFFPCADGLEG